MLGALAQSIPDVDFVAAFWNDPASNLLAHRGFTHSILFGVMATFLFALLAEHFHKQHRIGYKKWLLLFGVNIGVHLFIDLFNSYGIGLLEPFSHQRFSFNAIFVADPFFSIWPAISFVALLVLKRNDRRRNYWRKFGIAGASLYLFYCTLNKIKINNDVVQDLNRNHIASAAYFTTPTPLNNWLWYVVVKNKSGFLIGFHSLFDRNKNIQYHYFPQNSMLLDTVASHEEVQHLIRFSQGYYTVEHWHDTLVFNDLRFGQMIGWYDPNEKFVFHFFLQHPENDNRLVVQRGRFAKWNRETTISLLKRIEGN